MKRRGLTFVTLISLSLTGLLVVRAGWSGPEARGDTGPVRETVSLDSREVLSTPAAQRWLHGQPHHWRACLLQQ